MCFSAQASFIASAALLGVGLLTLRRVSSKRQALLATVPFIFSVQQAAEGMVWLYFTRALPLSVLYFGKSLFLIIVALWPLWIPLMILMIETNAVRRTMLYVCTVIGLIVSLYLFKHMLVPGVSVNVPNCHIEYDFGLPLPNRYVISILYSIAGVGAFCISSVKYMWVPGIALGISFVFSYYAYYQAFTSVWCFFAAILSILIYGIIKNVK